MGVEHVVLVLVAFFAGAMPFSLWVGFAFLRVDIRDYGDGNPGTFNVIRAGGVKWGGLALMLDISKGAAPVGLAAYIFNMTGAGLVLIAVAPVFGHAFSPFLHFKGGKAIATTGGMMIGLSLWQMPLVAMVALTFWYLVLTRSGWAVMFTAACVIAYLLLTAAPVEWLAAMGIITLLMIYNHRTELTDPPRLKLLTRSAGGDAV
ncbi:MAG: glycerol-3-phosphate acyltransferase [Anaerolineaceae bacterium]|nr:MAG: glycerol-3-phosphate acyltransferase [Anaerolineaceae bacterium]